MLLVRNAITSDVAVVSVAAVGVAVATAPIHGRPLGSWEGSGAIGCVSKTHNIFAWQQLCLAVAVATTSLTFWPCDHCLGFLARQGVGNGVGWPAKKN